MALQWVYYLFRQRVQTKHSIFDGFNDNHEYIHSESLLDAISNTVLLLYAVMYSYSLFILI